MAKIISIVYQPEDQEYGDGRVADFIRVPFESAQLVPNHGIKGDRKAGRNLSRQVNLLSTGWLAAKKAQGYKTAPGQFGEQLIIDGLDLDSLEPGTQLQLGDEACLEITKIRDGCERLEAAQNASGLAGKPIGMLTRVLSGGTIKVGDPVRVLELEAGD